MRWRDEPWLLLDLETTGVNIREDHPVEIGLVEFLAGEPETTWRWLVRPPISIPEGAAKVHGYDDAAVRDCPTIEDVAPEICAVLQEFSVYAGHNYLRFDGPILKKRLPGLAQAMRGGVHLDTLTLVRLDHVGRYWKGRGRHRLGNVAERLGIAVDESRTHGALYDCELAGRILWELRSELPEDGREAQRLLTQKGSEQEANFRAWKARQPPRES